MKPTHAARRLAVLLGAVFALSGVATTASAATPPIQVGHGPYNVEIRRTAHGIPHILANDFASIGYGYAYAFAQDDLCTIAESYVTVDAERSRFFGPDAKWDFRANSSTANNLNSDFFYQRINDSGVIDQLVAKPPPLGPEAGVKEGVKGYVDGYNRYLADTGVDKLPDPRCRGKAWVRPITEADVYRRFYQLASLASQGVAIDGIGNAQPLTGSAALQGAAVKNLRPDSLRLQIGSNAYGLGKDVTDNGKGMLLGNPHFPWQGPERLYQSHLTIPGKLDVTGGSLYGVPLILIGHTKGLAWSHTVATAYRFTPYELTLAPGDPTSYVLDGQTKKMQADKVTVKALKADGTLEDRTRTLYRSRYGPMITEILGLPLFPWSNAKAYSMADANELNFRYLNHFFDNNMAQDVHEYDAIERKYQGIPWVNSIAADSKGEAYYSMDGAIPNVPDAKVAACPTALGQVSFPLLGLPTLDGSKSSCDWDNDPDAVQPGLFGPSHIPRLFRNDYVTNGNDSHWLTNPNQPLTGFPRIIGDEQTARSLRTRLGLIQIQDRLSGKDGLPGNKFTLGELQQVAFGDRQYAGELWRDQLVALCKANPTLTGSNGPVDVSAACPVLEKWDVHDNLDSTGAILFRRFATHALGGITGPGPIGVVPLAPGPSPFSTPFDKSDPVNTPRGLAGDSDQVRRALADAVTDLQSSNIPLDAKLGDYQGAVRGERIPIHGGPGTLGVFNAINVPWVPGKGYPDVPHGSSFVMAMQFTDHGPESRALVTYSQSENPESPYYNDQTKLFSKKEWVDMKFAPEKIVSDPELKLTDFGCVETPAFTSTRVRASGRGAMLSFAPVLALPVTVDVFEAARGRHAHPDRRIAHFVRPASFKWSGLVRHRRLADGWYFARFRTRAQTGRLVDSAVAFSVRRGRLSARGPRFTQPDGCGTLRAFRLTSPVFGGPGHRALGVMAGSDAPGRITVRLKRGAHTVARVSAKLTGIGVQRIAIPARGAKAGAYRVIATVSAGGRRQTRTLSARAL